MRSNGRNAACAGNGVNGWLLAPFREPYFRLHDGTMIPLNDESRRTIHGVQPHDAFRSIIAQLAPCFLDDCGDIDIPTPLATVPPRPARTATPFPTDIPASLVDVVVARVEEFSPTWQVGGDLRCTLAFELPAGAQNPVLAYEWVDANGSGSTLHQLRLPSDGYPAPTH